MPAHRRSSKAPISVVLTCGLGAFVASPTLFLFESTAWRVATSVTLIVVAVGVWAAATWVASRVERAEAAVRERERLIREMTTTLDSFVGLVRVSAVHRAMMEETMPQVTNLHRDRPEATGHG